jgi:hypothetical protein
LRQLKKRKSKRPENPDPNDCVECSSERRKRSVCWDPNPSDAPSDSDTVLAIPLTDDATEEDNEQDAACTVLFVSLKTTMEESGKMCAMFHMGAPHFVLVWTKILFVSLFRDKLFFVFIVCIFVFVFFFNILYPFFCANSSPPQIRKMWAPN